jgi:hypothetical protein
VLLAPHRARSLPPIIPSHSFVVGANAELCATAAEVQFLSNPSHPQSATSSLVLSRPARHAAYRHRCPRCAPAAACCASCCRSELLQWSLAWRRSRQEDLSLRLARPTLEFATAHLFSVSSPPACTLLARVPQRRLFCYRPSCLDSLTNRWNYSCIERGV